MKSTIRNQQSAIVRPPILDGVGPSSQTLPPGPWKTMLAYLEEQFPRVQAATWESRMSRGLLVDETGKQINPASPYRHGIRIYYYRELDREAKIPFLEAVIYEDDHLLVVDKPHFLPVVPAGRFVRETLLVRLRGQRKTESLIPLHRLDRETAGVVLFSVNQKTRGHYTRLFRERKIQKTYEALAPATGTFSFPLTRLSRIVRGEPFFRMQEVAGEPNAETRIDIAETSIDSKFARYRLFPITGKKHQLRVHLAALGIPIMNDRFYPDYVRAADNEDDFSRPLQLLAKSIAFRDPITDRECYFESTRKL